MKRMPFGKHRGVLLSEIPLDYLEWLYDLEDLREETRVAVAQELERRNGPPPPPGSLADLVTAGYRALSLKYHPDHGGRTEDMQLLNQSVGLLREWIAEYRGRGTKR